MGGATCVLEEGEYEVRTIALDLEEMPILRYDTVILMLDETIH
jgi:hypothetical protein